MSECWHCFWGRSVEVQEIYACYVGTAGEEAMQFGPGHIVWADENLDEEDVQWCLDYSYAHRKDYKDIDDEQMEAVRGSLRDLLLLPANVRNPEPKDYDGKNPRAFPPTIPMWTNKT